MYTGTSDSTFDLIGILYHALQATQKASHYRFDAAHERDRELEQFFFRVMEENRQVAEEAKQLLRERLGQRSADDRIDEASEESFPASDPPAF